MNASASASDLNWRPTVRRCAVAGRSCGAVQSAAPHPAPYRHFMAWMGNWFGNPKGIVARSPGLAPCAYPGKGVGGFVNPNGVVPGPRMPPDGPQPRRGCCPIGRSPRVAPLAQPWAWRRNPVGIRAGNLAGRNLFDWFEADACKVQTIHPSCAHGGQPSSQVKPSQGQGRSSLVKPLALPGPETRDPRPETREVGQGQSRSVKPIGRRGCGRSSNRSSLPP